MKWKKTGKMLGKIACIGMAAALLAGGQALGVASAVESDPLRAAALSPLAAQAETQAAAVIEELRLKAGSVKATLNGEEWTIAKPYMKQGAMMVPLTVFTKAVGVDLNWSTGDVVTLGNGKTAVRMRLGQKQAMANGKAIMLPAAPEMVNGTVMAPLGPLAKAFGAAYTVAKDKSVVLTWNRANVLAEAAIDVSAKAVRFGDHVHRWSMVLPEGWSYSFLAPEENSVLMESPSGQAQAMISIHSWQSIEPAHLADQFAGEATGKQMLEHIKTAMFAEDAIMSSRIGTIDGKAYAQAVVNGEGMTLIRVFSAGGKRYTVFVYDKAASSPRQLLQYEPLLNTFRPNDVPASGAGVKDISTEKDGFRSMALSGDGLIVDIPVTWERSPDGNKLSALSDQGMLQLEFYSLRADKEATLDSLVRREEEFMKKQFRPEHRQTVSVQDVKLKSGQQAKLLTAKHRYNETDWRFSKTLIVLDEGVQFFLQYSGPDCADAVQLGERIVGSVRADGMAKEQLDDPEAWGDGSELWVPWTQTVERTSETWGLQMKIPEWWLGYRAGRAEEQLETEGEEGTIASYSLPSSYFMLHVNQVDTVEEALASWKESLLSESDPSIRFVKEEKKTWRGQPAMRVRFTGLTAGVNSTYTTDMLLIAKDGYVYTLYYTMYDVSRTPEMVDQFEKVVGSFRFVTT
ncbi:stalk domain-containing protein [Paenibacillus thiaminolyticus]|uniref:stalk domain-containing protein n=1 Tax=Paenibacillus thiaminolyticus TaxID=49283 RepID=UPI003D2912E3